MRRNNCITNKTISILIESISPPLVSLSANHEESVPPLENGGRRDRGAETGSQPHQDIATPCNNLHLILVSSWPTEGARKPLAARQTRAPGHDSKARDLASPLRSSSFAVAQAVAQLPSPHSRLVGPIRLHLHGGLERENRVQIVGRDDKGRLQLYRSEWGFTTGPLRGRS